jgi:CheY-like chemotaxis protein
MMKPNLVEIPQHEKQSNPESKPFKPVKFVKTQQSNNAIGAKRNNWRRILVRGSTGPRPPDPKKRTILLISCDTSFHQNLRCAANMVGRIVVRVDGATDVSRIVYALRPAVVLLDLDLPAGAGWGTADSLLQQENCPPVILLTASSEQFDMRTAIRAGSILDKSKSPAQLLEAVGQVLDAPNTNEAERNAIQRVMIGWLRPCNWSAPLAYRFWRINE